MATLQGKSIRRREDARLLTGKGSYGADLFPPGVLHAVLVRSPHAHATIRQIDATAAHAVPGVAHVLTGADLAGAKPLPGGIQFKRRDGSPAPKTDRPLLARDRVRFIGEPVAMVLADTVAAAHAAAEEVLVDYDALPVVTTPSAALQPGAPTVWDDVPDNIGFVWHGGKAEPTDAALRSAAYVTRLNFAVSRVTANPLEPRVAVAQIGSDGRLRVTAANQSPFGLRNALAQLFDLAPTDVHVVINDVGGSFGMKSGLQQEVALVAWAARKLHRPVRWVSERTEGFLSDDQAREMEISAELGFDAQHNIVALKLRWDVNLGAYVSGRSAWCIGNIGGAAGVYRIPEISAEVYGMMTHTVPTAAYRGAGRPEATYVIERLIDLAAREMGVDPFELRRQNLIPPDAMPYKTALTFTYDCGEFEENMLAAAKLAELDGFAARRAASEQHGKLRGLGICNCIEVAGGPFLRPGKDTANLRLAEDGKLILRSGAMSVGQGLETTMSQLVADRFGVTVDSIQYENGDTDLLPHGRGNGGSSALCVGGSAVLAAVDQVIEKAKRIAAELLEAAVADIGFEDGRFAIAGTDRFVDLATVARAAHDPAQLPAGETPGLDETAEWQPMAVTFPNGTHICEVEIDPDTGVTEIVRYSAIEEIGRVLNPLLVSGQTHGGVAQALGQVLGEQIIHDPASAQMLTASFMDYQMPRADDLPDIQLLTREVPTKVNPLGAKGVGEAGTVGGLAAAMNAVNDALAPLGIRHFDMPATPHRVWAAIQAARS
jgi:carbon-monoxide dehydrogenase large subunit